MRPPEDTDFVISLRAGGSCRLADVGGKAAGLAGLLELQLPVPPAFCVTTAAYRAHLHDVGGDILVGQLDTAAEHVPERALTELQDRLRGATLRPALAADLRRHWAALSCERVAVRSSATCEDQAAASFAGQHVTRLAVSGLAGVGDAVRECWASLWSPRAWEYRRRCAGDPAAAEMAVVIQAFVPALRAGVAFTVDPRSGAGAHIIIEAVHGLGPAAVEGRAAPARFVVDKRTLEVVEHTPGRQDQVLVASASSGAAWQAADPDRHGRPAATAGQIRTVARLAREIEAGLGAPQDIEWCAEDDRVWIVQARPLTVRRSSWASRQVWSNLNAGEVLPGVITPLTWSLVCAIQPMLRRLFRRAGVDLGAHPLVGRIGGRLYFNLNTITAVAVRFPGGKTQSFSQAFGGAHLNGGVGPIPPQDLPRIKGGLARLCAQMPAFLLWLLQHRAAVADRCLRRLERRRKQLEQRDLSARTDVVLVAELQRFLDALFDDHLLVYPVVGLGCFMLLKELCGRWFDEPSLANSLLTGSGGISSADAGLALWDVAGLAVGDELVLRELLQPGDFRQVRGRLESHAAGRDFLARWDAFMREHGHHCKGEIELRNPRWREQPDVILEMVRSYAAMLPQKNAAAEYRSRARARRRRARRCREALRNPFSRALFRGLLSSARKGMSVRETIKSEVVRHLAAVRSLVLELGRRWAACGRLAEADDAFFLELAELPLVAAGDPRFDARAAVAARRREFDHQQTLSAPPVVVGQDLPAPAPPGADAAPGQILRGLAVSSGQATGRARIIEHADSGGKLEAGEILVAPFTDPGWAPYFLPAAGIVVDIGGLLSHGSIVAREYGIPAVVNVGPATRTLRNGQLLHVDGDRGEVRVLEEC